MLDTTRQQVAARLQRGTITGRMAIEDGLLALLSQQTADEQQREVTNQSNGVGFTGADAAFMTSLAKFIQRSRYPRGERLTPLQFLYAERKIQKYARQLADLHNAKRKELVPCTAGGFSGASSWPTSVVAAPVRACPACAGTGRIETQLFGEYAEVECPRGCVGSLAHA